MQADIFIAKAFAEEFSAQDRLKVDEEVVLVSEIE